MKIIFKANVFNPTGMATANREIIKELTKANHTVQTSDIWGDSYDFNKGLEYLNNPINSNDKDIRTLFADYPKSSWKEGYGRRFGFFLHEGTKVHPVWIEQITQSVEKFFVPSVATKNLFKWSGLKIPIEVNPYGVSECYKPQSLEKDDNFIFLSVNSWTGRVGDRKGTDMLIKAFDEEFQPHEKVILVLKIGTFWMGPIDYMKCIYDVLGHINEKIMFNDKYVPEKDLVEYYNKSDCFVAPTRGEAFGLTLANAKACGIPLIVTKDNNSGHMDFCKDDSTLWIDTLGVAPADPILYCKGNYQPVISIKSLRKQMRYAFEHKDELRQKAIKNSEKIRKEFTWERTAKKLVEAMV